MSVPKTSAVALALVVVVVRGHAARAERAVLLDEPVVHAVSRAAADDDAFTPGLTHAAAQGRGLVLATSGFDGVTRKATVDLGAEVTVWGPVRLVLRATSLFGKGKPAVGAAVQWLDEGAHGVSSSAYFLYKTEGFTEAEGEIEGLVSFGKHLGPFHGTLNLAYGQDPEGRERDGEVALGLHIEPIAGLYTGVVGRVRDALGSSGDKATGVLRDATAGVSATYVVTGSIGVTATAGISGIKTVATGTTQIGPMVALAVGSQF